jgi:hypothetical protein
LAALNQLIDTTRWTVDLTGGSGTEHTALLLGHPVAVLRAAVRLEVQDQRHDSVAPTTAVPVKLGTLAHTQDGLPAYAVADDYTRVRAVDPAIGAVVAPGGEPITSPYVDLEPAFFVQQGQPVPVTSRVRWPPAAFSRRAGGGQLAEDTDLLPPLQTAPTGLPGAETPAPAAGAARPCRCRGRRGRPGDSVRLPPAAAWRPLEPGWQQRFDQHPQVVVHDPRTATRRHHRPRSRAGQFTAPSTADDTEARKRRPERNSDCAAPPTNQK